METFALDAARSVFTLYIIVSGNFLANIFGCRAQDALTSSMALKHLLGFMTMLFLVVLVDGNSHMLPHHQLLLTIVMYLVFVATTRAEYKYWVVFLVLLCANYLLDIYRKNDATPEPRKKQLQTAQMALVGLAGSIMAIGILVYFAKKYQEYGNSFEWNKFVFGKTQCSFTKSKGTFQEDFLAIRQLLGTRPSYNRF